MKKATPTRAGFDIDLREFTAFETDLIRVFISRGTNLIEHKRDMGTVRTGNVFIEYEQPSGPSGIATTDADMWAIEYDEHCWVIVPTERLKVICRLAWRQGRKADGGDYKRYKGLLVPIKWLFPPYVEGVE